jgi:glycosyltransferase involved in cell wall biosynthesis
LQRVWGVAAAKITVLLSGVNERFRPVADPAALRALRARYNLGDAPFVLAVGTVQPRKNYPLLVRAFRRVADRHPHRLVIAGGKGWMPEALLAEIDRQGLGDRVVLTGFVDDADLPALYSSADLHAFPSLYEGFGLPLLEAMACGTPVLSSNASSLPEVARGPNGGDAAVLLPPDDETAWAQAMLKVIEDPAERDRLVAAGHEQARRFSWTRSARQLLALYDALI